MPDEIKRLLESGAVRLAVTAFLVGVAWSSLYAEISTMQTELNTIRVLVCKQTPGDSMCAIILPSQTAQRP